jgi:hypothetical protein
MENPYLQGGQDQTGVETALVEQGAELHGATGGADLSSMGTGPAPAF